MIKRFKQPDYCNYSEEIINYRKNFNRRRFVKKEVINVDGEDRVVREDTAKSYRGVMWALLSLGVFIVIAAILFIAFGLKSATNDNPQKAPAGVEQTR